MAVAYKSAGSGGGTESNGATLTLACPATVDAGDILIAHVIYLDATSAPSTPSGWTLLYGPADLGVSTVVGRHWVFGKVAVGDEDGASIGFGTAGGTAGRYGRIYSFSGRESGTITDLVPSASFSDIPHNTDPQAPTVTTTIQGSLAVALVAQDDNNSIGSFTGESGGDWTEAVAEFVSTTLGAQGCMCQIQTATPTADPGTISGGTFNTANDECGVIGFEIKPKVVQFASITPATESDLSGTIGALQEVEQASESDSAQPLSFEQEEGSIEVDLIPATESDSSQAISINKVADLAPANESDSAQVLSGTKPIEKDLTTATEADSAEALAQVKSSTLEIASESDSAQGVGQHKTVDLLPAAEADTATSLSGSEPQQKTIDPAIETDSAGSLGRLYTIEQASENDSAQQLSTTGPIFVDITPAVETDSAQQLGFIFLGEPRIAAAGLVFLFGDSPGLLLSPATETDTAQPLTVTKQIIKTLALAAESDSAEQLDLSKALDIGAATATDEAIAADAQKQVSVAPGEESDSAQPIGTAGAINLTPGTESDSAQALDADKIAEIALASESDDAQGLTATKTIFITIAPAEESDEATDVAYSQAGTYAITPAGETDSAEDLSTTKTIFKNIGSASETGTAELLAPQKQLGITPAQEDDEAEGFGNAIFVSIGIANESDSAEAFDHAKTVSIVGAVESDSSELQIILKNVVIAAAVVNDEAFALDYAKTIYVDLAFSSEQDNAEKLVIGGVRNIDLAEENDFAIALVYSVKPKLFIVRGKARLQSSAINGARVTSTEINKPTIVGS